MKAAGSGLVAIFIRDERGRLLEFPACQTA